MAIDKNVPILAADKNVPILAAEMRALAAPGKYTVVVLTYDKARCVTWRHRTLKAATRRLGSACSGKQRVRDSFAAAIVTPESEILSWKEARTALA